MRRCSLDETPSYFPLVPIICTHHYISRILLRGASAMIFTKSKVERIKIDLITGDELSKMRSYIHPVP